MNKILTILTGLIGTGSLEASDTFFSFVTVTDVTKFLTQLIILVATIYALFKKKKPKK